MGRVLDMAADDGDEPLPLGHVEALKAIVEIGDVVVQGRTEEPPVPERVLHDHVGEQR